MKVLENIIKSARNLAIAATVSAGLVFPFVGNVNAQEVRSYKLDYLPVTDKKEIRRILHFNEGVETILQTDTNSDGRPELIGFDKGLKPVSYKNFESFSRKVLVLSWDEKKQPNEIVTILKNPAVAGELYALRVKKSPTFSAVLYNLQDVKYDRPNLFVIQTGKNKAWIYDQYKKNFHQFSGVMTRDYQVEPVALAPLSILPTEYIVQDITQQTPVQQPTQTQTPEIAQAIQGVVQTPKTQSTQAEQRQPVKHVENNQYKTDALEIIVNTECADPKLTKEQVAAYSKRVNDYQTAVANMVLQATKYQPKAGEMVFEVTSKNGKVTYTVLKNELRDNDPRSEIVRRGLGAYLRFNPQIDPKICFKFTYKSK